VPKPLFPVSGKPMIEYLFELYASVVCEFVLVLHPSSESAVRAYCGARALAVRYARQERPTGMLDAILAPLDLLRDSAPRRIWITWCDQIAIHPMTIRTLDRMDQEEPEAAVTFPTARRQDPYIHLERRADGRILRILHKREGDRLPAVGESDMGLFSLAPSAYFDQLVAFASEGGSGSATGERNFLPFIPWVSDGRGEVRTFACRDPREAVGVNDAADALVVQAYLDERRASGDA